MLPAWWYALPIEDTNWDSVLTDDVNESLANWKTKFMKKSFTFSQFLVFSSSKFHTSVLAVIQACTDSNHTHSLTSFNSHVPDQWLHVQTKKRAFVSEIQPVLKFLTIFFSLHTWIPTDNSWSGTLLENLEITIHSAHDNYNLTVEYYTLVKKMTLRSRGCYGIR